MAGRHTWSHQAAFEATPASASRARSFVVRHLVDHGLTYLVEPVRLVASELATNALVHAHTAFIVTLEARDGVVRLTVRDDSLSLPAAGRPGPGRDGAGTGDRRHRQPRLGDRHRLRRLQGGLGHLRRPGKGTF